tara:strand:+ start:1568 stop:1720 length:153 start_codon:yes stop_codon:yes gene_type:complete
MIRHTFETRATYSNGLSIETEFKLLGHIKLLTIQVYAKVIEKIVRDVMQI